MSVVAVAISSCIRAVSATAVVDFSKLLTCDFKEADGTFLESTNWGARDAVTPWNAIDTSSTLGITAWNSNSLFAGDKETFFDSSTTRLINIPTGRTDGFVIYRPHGWKHPLSTSRRRELASRLEDEIWVRGKVFVLSPGEVSVVCDVEMVGADG